MKMLWVPPTHTLADILTKDTSMFRSSVRHCEVTHWSETRSKPRDSLQKCLNKTNRQKRAPTPQCPGTHACDFRLWTNQRRRPEEPKRKYIPSHKKKTQRTTANPGFNRLVNITGTWLQNRSRSEPPRSCAGPAFPAPGYGGKVARCIEDEEESIDDRILTDLQVASTATG